MSRVEVNAPLSYDVEPDADAIVIPAQTRSFNWAAFARILIAALIVPELIYFSRPLDIAIVDGSQ